MADQQAHRPNPPFTGFLFLREGGPGPLSDFSGSKIPNSAGPWVGDDGRAAWVALVSELFPLNPDALCQAISHGPLARGVSPGRRESIPLVPWQSHACFDFAKTPR